MNHAALVATVGLALQLAGAAWLAWGLFLTKRAAIELGASRWVGGSDAENLDLPQVRDRLRQSGWAKVGLILITVGIVMQAIAARLS